MCAAFASCAAVLMCSLPRMLPIPREPECNTSHTRSSSSTSTSKKWLPEPRVPICWMAFVATTIRGHVRTGRRARPSSGRLRRCGPASRHRRPPEQPWRCRRNSGSSESGKSWAATSVRTAAIPQPMSTPTAAGMIALRVVTTEPTVAPLPIWASGISRTPSTTERRAVRSAWARVAGSMRCEPHTLSLSFTRDSVASIRSRAVRVSTRG